MVHDKTSEVVIPGEVEMRAKRLAAGTSPLRQAEGRLLRSVEMTTLLERVLCSRRYNISLILVFFGACSVRGLLRIFKGYFV